MLKNILNNVDLVTCQPDTKIIEVAQLMADKDVGAVVVLDEESDKPRGILTDRDIVVRCIAKNLDLNDTTVENVLTESLATVHETDGIFDCIQKMKAAGVRRIPVINDHGKAVGIVSLGDLMSILSEEFAALTESTCPHGQKREPMIKAA
jgi:signal-transduction protein with cAMP-binding, CBS, and nucleotidyltransferase domain